MPEVLRHTVRVIAPEESAGSGGVYLVLQGRWAYPGAPLHAIRVTRLRKVTGPGALMYERCMVDRLSDRHAQNDEDVTLVVTNGWPGAKAWYQANDTPFASSYIEIVNSAIVPVRALEQQVGYTWAMFWARDFLTRENLSAVTVEDALQDDQDLPFEALRTAIGEAQSQPIKAEDPDSGRPVRNLRFGDLLAASLSLGLHRLAEHSRANSLRGIRINTPAGRAWMRQGRRHRGFRDRVRRD
jgi:hypothetical protein